jgi:cytochrome P450
MILDLPFSDKAQLIPYADTITHSSDPAARNLAMQGVFAYADEWVHKRRAAPGDDLISQLLEVMIEDRPITHTETAAMVAVLLLGGLDSVSHTMGAIMGSLAEKPDLQRALVENPDLIATSLNELFRRHSVNAMARTLTEDATVGGVGMKAGDKVFLAAWLYGLDKEKWVDPLTIDLQRKPEIMAFGTGVHTCVGMNLARLEVKTLLEEWFKRIPSFTIKPGETPVTMTGQTLGTLYLPLSWNVS